MSEQAVRAVESNEIRDPAIPDWLKGRFRRIDGRDPLGLSSITTDRIMPALVPSILALSQRARYLSFYAFLLDEVFRHQHIKNEEELSSFIKQREFELAVTAMLCSQCAGEPGRSIVGTDAAGPAASSGLSVISRRESIKSYLGGYGLYYRTPLVELGVVAPKGELLQDGHSLPFDVLRPGKGERLAELYRSAIYDTEYYRSFFRGAQPIPRDVLAEFAETSCLCRLEQFPEERRALQDLLVGLPEYDSDVEETPESSIHRRLGVQRRRSFALILTAVDPVNRGKESKDRDDQLLRRVVWNRFETTSTDVGTITETNDQWAALMAKDYAQEALSHIWSDFCRVGIEAQPDVGLSRMDLQQCVNEYIIRLGISLRGATYPVAEPSLDTAEYLHSIDLALGALALEEVLIRLETQSTALGGLELLLSLYQRLPAERRSRRHWKEVATQSSNWQPGILWLLQAIDDHLQTSPNLGETMSWILHRFVIDVHERIAYSKLPDSTFRFRWENGRLRFFSDLSIDGLTLADTRSNTIPKLCRDLGLISKSPKVSWLTTAGLEFVEDAWQ